MSNHPNLETFSIASYAEALKEGGGSQSVLSLLRALLPEPLASAVYEQTRSGLFRVEDISMTRHKAIKVCVVFCRQENAAGQVFLPKQRLILEVGDSLRVPKRRWVTLTVWDQRDGGKSGRSSVRMYAAEAVLNRLSAHLVWLERKVREPLTAYWERQENLRKKAVSKNGF